MDLFLSEAGILCRKPESGFRKSFNKSHIAFWTLSQVFCTDCRPKIKIDSSFLFSMLKSRMRLFSPFFNSKATPGVLNKGKACYVISTLVGDPGSRSGFFAYYPFLFIKSVSATMPS